MKRRLNKSFNVQRHAFAALLVACLVLSSAAYATAAPTLASYRERVRKAMLAIDSLFVDEDAEDGGEAETLAAVRAILPVREKIDWNGETVQVDNEWLHQALAAYEGGASSISSDDRAEALNRIVERLYALEARLAEAEESAVPSGALDKDAEKGKLAAILRHPDYNRQPSEGGALGRLVEQIFNWIRDLLPDFQPVRPGASPRLSLAVQWIVLALGLLVVAFFIRKYWWRHAERLKGIGVRKERVILGERLEEGVTPADLLSEAERLARAGDLRGAIRKSYVALLCELGDRKLVRLAQHKTNRDYLRAVRRSAPRQLYQEMQPLTAEFERHWYGLEPADDEDWNAFRARTQQALKAL